MIHSAFVVQTLAQRVREVNKDFELRPYGTKYGIYDKRTGRRVSDARPLAELHIWLCGYEQALWVAGGGLTV